MSVVASLLYQEPIEWISPDDDDEAAVNGQSDPAATDEGGELVAAGGVIRNGTAAADSGLAGSVELGGGQQPGGFNPFLSLPTERNACDYKRGYVIR
jgi:hypothetical protein